MKLEQQIVSLRLAQKLKKLGFEQISLWYWQDGNIFNGDKGWKIGIYGTFNEDKQISAYTVAELGEMLPWDLEMTFKKWWSTATPKPKRKAKHKDSDDEEMNFVLIQTKCRVYSCYYMEDYDSGCCIFNQTGNSAKKEADARAKMLIYLKENNLLK